MYLRMPIYPSQLGRRLQWYTKNWKVLTNDPWILHFVQAVHLELLSLPFQFQKPLAPNFSKLRMDFFAKEVDSLREEGAIEITTSEDKQFVGFLFLKLEKERVKYRPVFRWKNTLYQFKVLSGCHKDPRCSQNC